MAPITRNGTAKRAPGNTKEPGNLNSSKIAQVQMNEESTFTMGTQQRRRRGRRYIQRMSLPLKQKISEFLNVVVKDPVPYVAIGHDIGTGFVDMAYLKDELLQTLLVEFKGLRIHSRVLTKWLKTACFAPVLKKIKENQKAFVSHAESSTKKSIKRLSRGPKAAILPLSNNVAISPSGSDSSEISLLTITSSSFRENGMESDGGHDSQKDLRSDDGVGAEVGTEVNTGAEGRVVVEVDSEDEGVGVTSNWQNFRAMYAQLGLRTTDPNIWSFYGQVRNSIVNIENAIKDINAQGYSQGNLEMFRELASGISQYSLRHLHPGVNLYLRTSGRNDMD